MNGDETSTDTDLSIMRCKLDRLQAVWDEEVTNLWRLCYDVGIEELLHNALLQFSAIRVF